MLPMQSCRYQARQVYSAGSEALKKFTLILREGGLWTLWSDGKPHCTHAPVLSLTSEDSGGDTCGFMMNIHLRVLRCCMIVDNILPEVNPFVFLFSSCRDRVGFRPTSEFELRYWLSVLRVVAFLQRNSSVRKCDIAPSCTQ